MIESLLKIAVDQFPLISTIVSTNKDEKNLKIIRRLSVAVVVISVVTFICGIVSSIFTYDDSLWQGSWCPLVPFTAGILGLILKSNSKSNKLNGVFMGFSIAGALMSIVLISIEISFLYWNWEYHENSCPGIFITVCGSALMILLVVSSVFAFKRCVFLSEKENTTSVNSSNDQPEKLVLETKIQQLVSQLSFGNQPVVIQIFPSAHVMFPGSNLMVPVANEMVQNANENGDFYPEKVSDQPPQYKN